MADHMKTAYRIYGLLSSLRTTIWLLPILLALLFYGSIMMQGGEEYQSLQALPLFRWLLISPLSTTWWLWTAMGVLVLLTINTLICTLEAVVRKRRNKQLMVILSPQIIHAGFLFILLAHLLSSYGSVKGSAYVSEGTVLELSDKLNVRFERIGADSDPRGYITGWTVSIGYHRGERFLRDDLIRPNSPSFQDGFGIYVKAVRVSPYPVALVEVSREPGAIFALAGGILFVAGTIMLLIQKIWREEKLGALSKQDS
jgi:hypothetical protein